MKRALRIKERTEPYTREGKVKPRYEQHTAVPDFKQRGGPFIESFRGLLIKTIDPQKSQT